MAPDELAKLDQLRGEVDLLDGEGVDGVDRLPGGVEDGQRLGVAELPRFHRGVEIEEPGRQRRIRVDVLVVVGLYPFFDAPSMQWAIAMQASVSMLDRRSMKSRGFVVSASTHVSSTAFSVPSCGCAMRRLW